MGIGDVLPFFFYFYLSFFFPYSSRGGQTWREPSSFFFFNPLLGLDNPGYKKEKERKISSKKCAKAFYLVPVQLISHWPAWTPHLLIKLKVPALYAKTLLPAHLCPCHAELHAKGSDSSKLHSLAATAVTPLAAGKGCRLAKDFKPLRRKSAPPSAVGCGSCHPLAQSVLGVEGGLLWRRR